MKKIVLSILLFFLTLNAHALTVDAIDKELEDMYSAYRARLSDQAVETILAIKPLIEFYDDEAGVLVDSLGVNLRRLFPALKTVDGYVLIYMAIFETLVAEDELYVYPILDLFNQNIAENKILQENFKLMDIKMKDFMNSNPEEQADSYFVAKDSKYKNVYFDYNVSKGELEKNVEQGKLIKKRFEIFLKRRNMLKSALRECLSRVLLDELQL